MGSKIVRSSVAAWLSVAHAWAQDEASGPVLPADPFAAVAAMAAAPAAAQGIEVRVTSADGKPEPAAIVILMASQAADYGALRVAAERRYPGDEPRILAARATRGVRYQVDERGATRVPSQVPGRIVAVHGDRVASVIRETDAVRARTQGGPVALRLLPPIAFTVTVVAAGGAPAAGVPVGIAADVDAFPFPVAATGADGTVHFRVLPGRPASALVQVLAALNTPRSCALPADGGQARLELPPCGSVAATLLGEVLPGSEADWSLQGASGQRRTTPATADARSARFDHVEVGFTGSVVYGLDGGNAGSITAPIGDVVAGQEQKVAVQRAAGGRQFVVRVLGPDGQPASRSFLHVDWDHATGSSSTFTRTNAAGWAELVVPERVAEGARLRVELSGAGWGTPLVGWSDLAIGKLDPVRTVHGDLRMAAATVALQGTVVDDAGRPVPTMDLSVRAERRHYQVATTADGTFAVALPEPHPAQVRVGPATDAWFLAEGETIAEFASGQKGVRLVVRPAARIRFGARGLPDGVRADFDVVLEQVEGSGAATSVQMDFSARELRVPPGHWNFVVKLGDQEVHRLDGVRADAGVETHDPRFMDFDWRQFATLVTVHVENQDGRPTDACTVWHHYANMGSGSSPSDGVAHLLVPKDGGKVSVEPADTAIATIDLGLVTGEHTVRLGGGPLLTVVLSTLPKLPDGCTLLLRVGDDHEGVGFDAERTARIWLAKAGAQTLGLSVRQGDRIHQLSWSQAVEVGAAGQRAAIELTKSLQEQIDRAVR